MNKALALLIYPLKKLHGNLKQGKRMMKTKNSIYALSLALMALCFFTPPAVASVSNLLEMSEKFDQADKQDFQGALDQANSCTRARNFSCSDEQLRKAAKLANGGRDRQALNTATQNLQAERQRVRDEATAKAERERQIQLAEEREAEERRREKRRQREEASAPSANSAESQLKKSQNDLDALFTRTNRQLQDNTNRAFQQQREQAAARQREADEARAEKNERIRRQNQRVALQEQARQQDQAQQQERARQANNSAISTNASNSASQSGSPSYGEVRKKNRCIEEFGSSGEGATEEAARANALKRVAIKSGGPDNKAIISSEVVSCRDTQSAWGFSCHAVTKYEVDTDGGSRGAVGRCGGGVSAVISK